MKTIAVSLIKQHLKYSKRTGHFTWIKLTYPRKRQLLGRRAGCLTPHGYIFIKIFGKTFYAHRLAWAYVNGEWPKDHLDHKNGIRNDNRWSNLRIGGYKYNNRNRGPKKTNTTGLKGVGLLGPSHKTKRFSAKIVADGNVHNLGHFATAEEAHAVYCKAAKRLHGEYARIK